MDCKRATYLISKKQGGKLSLIDRIKLQLHLKSCTICKAVERDFARFKEAIQKNRSFVSDHKLDPDARKRIHETLSKEI